MNIRQAREYVKASVKMYLKKGENGEYRIPPVRQRPIFLLGAPGIGKTAVMEQVAQELGIALVSYSMTHHTRQSALGLPFIRHRVYGGVETDVSEYTMSEIISSVYDVMEESGIREGILFLDEINCVSETLAPAMLQFLQYKTFGRHQVPEGWAIVTAGNPPEYNRSVRAFDIATLDRLRILEVEADYGVWKAYALSRGVHGAIISFLDLKKEYFYRIETTGKGRAYVTARGWEDLSVMLTLYEEEGLEADETLVGQYLRIDRIVKEFTAYYDLYRKYKKDYHTEEILGGYWGEEIAAKAAAAPFDERISLMGLLLETLQGRIRETMRRAEELSELGRLLSAAHRKAEGPDCRETTAQLLEHQAEAMEARIRALQKANTLSDDKRRQLLALAGWLREGARMLREREGAVQRDAASGRERDFALLKERFGVQKEALSEQTARVKEQLHHLFCFVETVFAGGNELLILTTELTADDASSRFIAAFGCEDYQRHSRELMLSERQLQLRQEIEALV
ncbi:MAG: AAA family ATPase [Eubacteriales bacterium]|nr:AAA family ATPase [Eubacteriales bacterium]